MPNKLLEQGKINLLNWIKGNWAKEHSFTIAITLVSLIVMLFTPESSNLLRYQSIEVSQGEWWRIFSANLCHSNWYHWLLNILGFWLMDIFYRPVLSVKMRASLIIFCMFANVLLMHLFMNLTWYVGLSGALHGYLIGGALLSWKSAIKLNLIIVIVVCIKLVIELGWHINQTTESLIGANVVEESHAFGALSAIIFFVINYLKNKIRNQ